MFPSQTSLIPIGVAVARFIEAGNSLYSSWYPYWYLGVPAIYLLGPVVPTLLVLLHKFFPGVGLFNLSFILITFSFIAGVIGWGVLARRISENRIVGILVFVFAAILPWRYLASLALEETTFLVARNFLPWVLFTIYYHLKESTNRRLVVCLLALSLLLLVNTSILPILIVGAGSIILAVSFREGEDGKPGKLRGIWAYLKRFLKVLGIAVVVVTLWYTPGYWKTILFNPSIGGASVGKVLLRIFEILRNGLPFFLAIASVFFSGKFKSRITVFTLTWLLTFIFLSVFRLLGDPDFWQDWSSWFYELEIGIAFLAAQAAASVARKNGYRYSIKIYIVIFILFLSPYWLSFRVYQTLGRPKLVSKTLPDGISSLAKAAELADGTRVFLSGSTVFWANALYDIDQVRGGQDKVAIHPYWDHAAYQIREGDSSELTSSWLQSLGVKYVLVHTPKSYEYYHDFVNLSKWEDVGRVVWQGNGDMIFELPKTSLAWEDKPGGNAGKVGPKGGADLAALTEYLSSRSKPVEVTESKTGYRILLGEPGTLVSLVITYDSGWRAYGSDGRALKVKKDTLGNILIETEEENEIFLKY